MSKQYYVCDIIPGPGTTPENGNRPAIADVIDPAQGGMAGFNYSVQMPPDDADGNPTKDWCLVIVSGRNHALLRNVPGVDRMFAPELDRIRLDAIKTSDKNRAMGALNGRGINTGRFRNDDAVVDVMDRVGKDLEPTFDVEAFDVSE
ncbi:MAG: hypothetical protein ACPGVG_13265 [Mycobacterium sp.]